MKFTFFTKWNNTCNSNFIFKNDWGINIDKQRQREVQHAREMSFSLGSTNGLGQAREMFILNYHYEKDWVTMGK